MEYWHLTLLKPFRYLRKIAGLSFLAVTALIILLLLMTYHISRLGQLDNVWPEIVGFCLDGIFFVFIIGRFQRRQEKKRLEKAKATLKNSLSHFIRDFVWWMSVGAVQDMNKITRKDGNRTYMVSVLEQAKTAIESLKKGQRIPSGMIDAVKRYGGKESIMLKCLLPVAAQIDDVHLKIWFNIIRALDGIVEMENEQNIDSTSLYFLEEVVEFLESP